MHYVSSQYYKQKKNFAEFYKSSLLYLAFVSSESLPVDLKRVRLACMVLLCCRQYCELAPSMPAVPA